MDYTVSILESRHPRPFRTYDSGLSLIIGPRCWVKKSGSPFIWLRTSLSSLEGGQSVRPVNIEEAQSGHCDWHLQGWPSQQVVCSRHVGNPSIAIWFFSLFIRLRCWMGKAHLHSPTTAVGSPRAEAVFVDLVYPDSCYVDVIRPSKGPLRSGVRDNIHSAYRQNNTPIRRVRDGHRTGSRSDDETNAIPTHLFQFISISTPRVRQTPIPKPPHHRSNDNQNIQNVASPIVHRQGYIIFQLIPSTSPLPDLRSTTLVPGFPLRIEKPHS
jgi:hypothetical protein